MTPGKVDTPSPPKSFTTNLKGATTATAGGGVEGAMKATLPDAIFQANAGAALSDFSVASVDWGDGSSDAAGLSISGSDGSFTVTGSHLYAEEGAHDFTIAVHDAGGQTTTISGSADVADALLTAFPGPSFSVPEGVPFTNQLAATFTDANPNAELSDFPLANVSIDWGDGSPATNATSLTLVNGAFQVFASHTYGLAGNYSVHVNILDVGGASASTAAMATAASNLLVLAPARNGALRLVGNATIQVSGAVQVDSTSAKAVIAAGNAAAQAGSIAIVGGDKLRLFVGLSIEEAARAWSSSSNRIATLDLRTGLAASGAEPAGAPQENLTISPGA